MLALPQSLTRTFVAAHSQFHDAATSPTERNTIATDMLAEFRQHDPNISIWDLLPLFDAKEISK